MTCEILKYASNPVVFTPWKLKQNFVPPTHCCRYDLRFSRHFDNVGNMTFGPSICAAKQELDLDLGEKLIGR